MSKQAVAKILDKQKSEEATGCVEAGLSFKLYARGGREVEPEEALDLLEDGKPIEVPAAGSGSYHRFAELLGLEVTNTLDNSSSSGDWAFRLEDGRTLSQTNRYPFYGFIYSLHR